MTGKNELIQQSEISILLDTYDDIFSDFDPRPYSKRTLSDDFIAEAKKASRNKPSGAFELHFLIPQKQRNAKYEEIIKRRVREYFHDQYVHLQRQFSQIRIKAVFLTVLGICLMIAAAYVRTKPSQAFSLQMLYVLFDPAGWFSTWFGLERLISLWTNTKPELIFHQKMARCEIIFSAY